MCKVKLLFEMQLLIDFLNAVTRCPPHRACEVTVSSLSQNGFLVYSSLGVASALVLVWHGFVNL
jgi:hypothetical protein